jgi:hypothetical protein
VKPFQIGSIKELIRRRLADPRTVKRVKVESVATILERESDATIQNWLDLVEDDAELTCIPLSRADRTGHLPRLVQDLVVRLRLASGSKAPRSIAAHDHGNMRREQGYTVPMVIEESRILQVSIFTTLQRNMRCVDFSKVQQSIDGRCDHCGWGRFTSEASDDQLRDTDSGFIDGDFETSGVWTGRVKSADNDT